MSDLGDLFNEVKKAGQQKRAENRERSPQYLTDHDVSFISKNYGAHLIVEGDIDFWPGTGKWIARKDGTSGRGVKHLVDYINVRTQETP